MTLATIESKSGGMTSPAAMPRSTRTPGPDARSSTCTRPGVGAKPIAGILGVQARLDRVADGLGRLAFEPAAGGDVQLQLDEIEAGDGLGDGVLDLQARVDLHEGEALLLGLVEELDRAGVAVAGLRARAGARPP